MSFDALLLFSTLMLSGGALPPAMPNQHSDVVGREATLGSRHRFMLIPFPEATEAEARRLPDAKPLLWPFRAWLLDREHHLVTSIHRKMDLVRLDALREGLDTILMPSLERRRIQGKGWIEVRMEALDTATGRRITEGRARRELPMDAAPAQVEALLPGLAEEVYARLFRP